MYQQRRRNIGPLTSIGRFRGRSFTARRYNRGRYGYAYPTRYAYNRSRRSAHIGASRGFAGYHLTHKEKKYLNTQLIAAGPANYPIVGDVVTNANVIGLNLLAEGTDYTNRISRKTHTTSLQIRVKFQMTAVAITALAKQLCRFMVIFDMQPNGVVPAISDVLDVATVNITPVAAPMNLNNRDRFRVVMDKTFKLDYLQTPERAYNVFKNCMYETVFNAAGAGVATVTSGALWFFAVSDQASGTSNPIIAYDAPTGGAYGMIRIRFVDG